MGSPDNFTHLEAIADTIGAAVGASAAVDTWEAIPHSMQVGQTGKTVNPSSTSPSEFQAPSSTSPACSPPSTSSPSTRTPTLQSSNTPTTASFNVEDALPVLHESLKGMMA